MWRTMDHWDGISYKTELAGEDSEECEKRDHLIISQNAHVCQRSAVFGDWLYMRTVHDGYHLFDKEMLYNIARDPHERFDLKEQHPEICAKGAKYILDWIDEQMLKDPSGGDPMWTVMREGGPEHTKVDITEYIERLKQTGRADGAAILEERYFKKK